MTSCGILRKIWEKCRDAIDLLRALNIRFELRDLNIDSELADELADRMKLTKNNITLTEKNEKKQLAEELRSFRGRTDCQHCAGRGYFVCRKCNGAKKSIR
ncbi:hypothetical protein WR25_07604 [Diploscapter pachys]|uniref:Uncharacterized protein n=1 Tax=Diploscapter pachys TaxID=2018661 RepID=A0A2A2KQY3_9BILA|nr:hypothetical protein WR25_07604 [Diploscapter pachys]